MRIRSYHWRTHDLIWVFLFSVLIWTLTGSGSPAIVVATLLGIGQIAASKIPLQPTNISKVTWVGLKFVLVYALIGYTSGVDSIYWPLLILPVVSAATALGPFSTLVFGAATGSFYFTFLLWARVWASSFDPTPYLQDMSLRVVVITMVGNLTNLLAEDLRRESAKYRLLSEKLAVVNARLQEAEATIRRSERLAAMGQLTAGLAHELRNPLATIKGSSEILGKIRSSEGGVGEELTNFIISEVDRCNSLIGRFLQFARPFSVKLELANLESTIVRAIRSLNAQKIEVSVSKDFDKRIPNFSFDAELIESVFLNLLVNAAQASKSKDLVIVKTRLVAGSVEIDVIDHGVGIDPANLTNIFNPFFTTKSDGVGLGLAIVARIVDEHGGAITVESKLGTGTTFHVVIPLSGARSI